MLLESFFDIIYVMVLRDYIYFKFSNCHVGVIRKILISSPGHFNSQPMILSSQEYCTIQYHIYMFDFRDCHLIQNISFHSRVLPVDWSALGVCLIALCGSLEVDLWIQAVVIL